MEPLQIVWFVAIAVLWTGYLVLEGFDLGVGMLLLVGARGDAASRERDRRVMLNTIGPVWDGNEVWLITAGAAIFAAFPLWYASLFSTLYLPLTFVLLGLILRAVAIEFRGKQDSDRWRTTWTWALGVGSFVSAFGIGAALALTTTGLPIDGYGDRVGGPFAWFSPAAIIGGLAVVGFSVVHAQAFLALKSDGPVRERATRFARGWGLLLLAPIVVWVLLVQFRSGSAWSWALVVVAVLALAGAVAAALRRREGWTFVAMCAFVVAGAAAIFTAAFPVLIPSTLDPAFDLTIMNASSSDYTLGVMTVVAAFGLPLVLGYQAWSYWVFRKRVGPSSIPAPHAFAPAVGADA